jgi:hypothetical protein
MRYPSIGYFGLLVATSLPCTQESAISSCGDKHDCPNPPEVVCHSKAAMRRVMDSGYSAPDPTLVNKLAEKGDCLLVPYNAIKTISFPTDNGNGPAEVTVQTDRGIVKLWGYPVGE